MILINEWLPNPPGSDADGEWVELWNNGNEAVALGGWRIETQNGQKFVLKKREIGVGEYLALYRSDTKLSLRNQNGGLSLYDAGGLLVHKASYVGSAPEGKSINRLGSRFLWSEPTPGIENRLAELALIEESLSIDAGALRAQFWSSDIVFSLVLTALFLSGFTLFITKRNHGFSELFFGSDKTIR